MMEEIKKYSQEVTSNYAEPQPLKKKISNDILDKYLAQESPCSDAVERIMLRVLPYWSTTTGRIRKNIVGMMQGEWQFEYLQDGGPVLAAERKITSSIAREINDDALRGKNISVYLLFWMPLSTMLLAHLLHDQPEQPTRFGVAGTGIIMFFSSLLISFGLFVYCNVLNSPYNLYMQHLCTTSYITILAFLLAVLCAASPTILLLPMTLLYIVAATALHFRIYNRAVKPTLFQMIVLLLMLAFFYTSNACLYYANFSWFWNHQTVSATPTHQLIRHFTDAPHL